MAALGAVGAFTRTGDSALDTLTITPSSPTGVTRGAPHGQTGRTTGDSGVARGGAMYIGQAVQAASTR